MQPNPMVLTIDCPTLRSPDGGFARPAPGIHRLFRLCAAAERTLQDHH